MDKKNQLEGELRLTEVGRDLFVNVARSKLINPSSIIDDKKIDIIPIPEGATIGDMIEVILPNAEVNPNPYIPSVDIYMGGILMMRVDRNLWNAKYKKVVEE